MYDEAFLAETLRIAFEDPLYYKLPTGIRRHDYAHVHGWWVRIQRDRTPFRHLFSDGVYGSPQEALRRAIIHRHSVLAAFPVTVKYVSHKMLPPEPEKRISRHVEKGKLRPYIYWKAKWYDKDHKVRSDTFPVHSLGEEEAKAAALQAAAVRHNKKPKLSGVADLHLHPQYEAISRADVEVLASISSDAYSSGGGEVCGARGRSCFICFLQLDGLKDRR